MFPGGQVGPVNANLCTGYTDPQHQTDENSCLKFLSTIESAITDYCSDNSDAAECADTNGNPALLANLVPYDQLPDGVKRLLPEQNYLGRFGYDTPGGAAAIYSPITRGKAPVMWEAANVWAAIIEDRLGSGGSLRELEHEVNVGYLLDPLMGNVYRNDISRIEGREVLEYAYRHPSYYQILHDNGFPVPFAMNDFDPATTDDDSARSELNGIVDGIKAALSSEWRGISQDDEAYKEELARRIFEWLMEWKSQNEVTSDLDNERPDYEAYRLKKGECSELSAILYYLYDYAGLEPIFLVNQDFQPTLSMLLLLGEEESDHVVVGIPRPWGRTLRADPAGEMFDIRLTDSIAISPMEFALATISNTMIGLEKRRDFAALAGASQLYLRMAPDSITPYLATPSPYILNPTAFNDMKSNIAADAADHPLAAFIVTSLTWYRSFLSGDNGTVDSAESDLNRVLQELEAKDSKLAALAYSELDAHAIRLADAILQGQIQFDDPSEMAARLKQKAKAWLEKAVILNPNDVFAINEYYKTSFGTGRFSEAAEFLEARVAQHPSHSLFRYFAAKMSFFAAANKDTPQPSALLDRAIDDAHHLIAIEPMNPIPYLLLADFYFTSGREDESSYYWSRAKDLLVAPYDHAAVIEFVRTGLLLGKSEDVLAFFDGRSWSAMPEMLYNEVMFEPIFNDDEVYVRRTRNVFDTVKSLLERAASLPGADAALMEIVYTKYAFLAAVMEGADEARNWAANTGDMSSPAKQHFLRTTLGAFYTLLTSSRHCDLVYLKNIYDSFSWMTVTPNTDASELLARTFVQLALRFARAGELEMARASLDKARETDEEATLEALGINRLLSDLMNGTSTCRTFFGIPCGIIRNSNEQHGH